MSECAVYTVASAEIADTLGTHYYNQLNAGNAINWNGNWIAYSNFSEKIYSYLINLIEIREMSESYMSAGNFKQPAETVNKAIENIKKCKGENGRGGLWLKYINDQLKFYDYSEIAS